MNINFRKSLRKSSRSSTFYLESFEMYDRKLTHLSLEDVNRFANSSLPVIDFRRNEYMIPIKPIASVIKFNLNSDRSTGTIGQIVLTNFRLKFVPYSHERQQNGGPNFKEESGLNGEQSFMFPPFELVSTNESKTDEDVEYLNIYDLICQQNLLQIYCSDFRCLEFQFRSPNLVKSLADQLERLIIKPVSSNPISQLSQNLSPSMSSIGNSVNNFAMNRDFELTYFWTIIASQYQFNYPKEWEAHEGYWYSRNNQLRISQANENYQLCKSLPASFITLRHYLTDVNLLQNISAKMKGQRVPIITYSHKCKSRNQPTFQSRFNHHRQIEQNNMLIRSGIMNKEASYLLIQAVSPMNIIDVNEYLPDVQNFVSIYLKLREASFLHANTTHFLSQIGKWMKLVCKVLSVVNDLSKILEEESSLLLMENNDNHWNILLSCLIQITLDKNRRTIEGFNSLLSKEWIYLVGLRSSTKLDHNKLPNQILFTLLLDCVYQMIHQNSTEFEFTSLYLIRCFDLSFLPYSAFVKLNGMHSSFKSEPIKKSQQHLLLNKQSSPVQFSKLSSANNSFNLNNSFHHHFNSSNLSPILTNLTFTQTLFYFNPFYNKNSKPTNSRLTISSSILAAQFWRPLYLRWSEPFRNLNYYNQFHLPEYLYFKELISSNSNYNLTQKIRKQAVQEDVNSSQLSNNCSVNNDTSDGLEDSFEHF